MTMGQDGEAPRLGREWAPRCRSEQQPTRTGRLVQNEVDEAGESGGRQVLARSGGRVHIPDGGRGPSTASAYAGGSTRRAGLQHGCCGVVQRITMAPDTEACLWGLPFSLPFKVALRATGLSHPPLALCDTACTANRRPWLDEPEIGSNPRSQMSRRPPDCSCKATRCAPFEQ